MAGKCPFRTKSWVRVLRAGLALALGLGISHAYADHDADVGIVHGDFRLMQGHGNGLGDFGGQMQADRYYFSSLMLADASEQAKRIDGLQAGSLAVIYPDIGEPFRAIFAKIIQGIEDVVDGPVRTYAIGPGLDAAELNAQLKRNGTKVVIALGRQGVNATSGLDRDMHIVVGGVLAAPEAESRNFSGVSLTPDPALLFSRLKMLLPGARRVIVVYNPLQNDWLIKLAREAARVQGLELVAHEARDLASAARTYEAAFASSDARRDVIWLPQDATTVEEATILPLVLKESWNRNVPVFSSSFLHVKKGALFALYPDNVELGRTLASLAGDARRRGLLPLRDVQLAVNLRMASHLGLNIGYQQQRGFDYIFPEP